MKARDPMTKAWKYFVDKCLPFGSLISCALFQCFSDALRHITEHRLQVRNRIMNYLDDFLFVAITIFFCNYMINQFLNLCKELGIPVSLEKTEWASDLMIILGILLNRSDMSLAVPLEKQKLVIELLTETLAKRKSMVQQMQKLCGYLNFLSRAIILGRTFT